ncbi:MAG: RNA polymerase sigma factor [Alicyclobacillus macrosporangiidus]|uniref:RNA polymerase sigma factor n=1 Tax=Alicyclobacillus macrosporangiidus TaxID=392015 RepID=UPI0026F0751B|nr:RNA polymerase sigma factor [Alicyclobacillus macrosporangiidus]MCL6599921.1 RNA polymerase sigma factor [Alicyclobacillus macrosporangiidus]
MFKPGGDRPTDTVNWPERACGWPPAATSDEADAVRTAWLQRLVAEHQSRLIHLAASYLGSIQSAEDCVQEVFITAVNRLDPRQPPAAVRTWLTTCTVNRARSMLRARRVRRWVLMDAEGLSRHAAGRPDDYAALDESGVLAEVMRLPVKYREVLVMRYYHDMSVEETAAVLGVSSNTVKTRLRRAKERLRQALEQMDREG